MALAVHLVVILMGVVMMSRGLMDIYCILVLVLFYMGLCWSLRYLKARFARETNMLCSKWYDILKKDQRDELSSLLSSGDIVEIRTKHSPDFAICVENDQQHGCRLVLSKHTLSASKILSSFNHRISFQACQTDMDQLTDVVKAHPDLFMEGSNIRINNARDKVSRPKTVEDIVRMMREAVRGGEEVFGDIDHRANECRHFAERARYPKEALDNRLSRDRGWWLSWWFGPPHCSPWFREEDLETFRWLLRLGDMVEFDRGLYSHWAIVLEYDGSTLFHRSGCNVMQKGSVKFDSFSDVIKGCKFRINNSLDKKHEPMCIEETNLIFMRNSECYGGYNLALNNCKRYVEQMRYGIHFRRNLGLILMPRPSVLALRPFLHEGDIITWYDTEVDQVDFLSAVYLGKELDKNGPEKIVYGCYHGGERGGPSNVVVEPLEKYHERMSTCAYIYINNVLDHEHPPLELEEIVDAVKTATDRAVTCKCRPFQNSHLLAKYFRNGSAERRAARTRSLTSRSWRILGNLYSAWHRLVCKDCHPS